MAGSVVNESRRSLVLAPSKMACAAADFPAAPPIVEFFSESAPYVGAGLGVMIAHNWALTCEHIIAGGARHFCNTLDDTAPGKIEVVGAYIEGCSIFVRPDRFSGILGYRARIDPYQERLALVRVKDGGGRRKTALPWITHIKGRITLWASNRLLGDSASHGLAKVEFSSFSSLHGARCQLTEDFLNTRGAVVEGDSGGGFFAEGPFGPQLVAIQNACCKVRGRNTMVALGIPVQPAESWIHQVITDG